MISQWAVFIRSKGKVVPNAGNFNGGDGDRGPGWFDVYDGLRRLEKRLGVDVRLQLGAVRSVNGKWGIRAVVYVAGLPRESWAGGYGAAFPGGCRTLASACWRAVFNAETSMELDASTRSLDGEN